MTETRRKVSFPDGTFAYVDVIGDGATGAPVVPGETAFAEATISAVASSASSVPLLPASQARRGVLITNTDANTLRVKYGASASATSFSVAIPANGYWEMPQPIYAGLLEGIWGADGEGSAIITELT